MIYNLSDIIRLDYVLLMLPLIHLFWMKFLLEPSSTRDLNLLKDLRLFQLKGKIGFMHNDFNQYLFVQS